MKQLSIVGFRRPQSGIDYHRVIAPLEAMQRDQGVKVNFANDPRDVEREDWEGCTHIVASRFFAVPLKQIERFKLACERQGVKLVVDVDDWWYLPPHHPKSKHYLQYEIPQRIEACLSIADIVWTTNKVLKKKARKFNDNIHIIPNAVDSKLPQWQEKRRESKKVRFGYIAGNHHQTDLDAAQIDLSELESYTVDIDQYPEMLQAKYILAPQPASEYGRMYARIDVSLIPLIASAFNKCKSHLKLIEAGFTGTAVICSPVAPYHEYLRDGENCLTASTPQEWEAAIQKLKDNPKLVKKLAAELSKDMRMFEMEHINNLRLETL